MALWPGVDDAVFVEQRRLGECHLSLSLWLRFLARALRLSARVPELDRWLQVLLLKPQTRTHLLLFQFLGLVEGWDGAELEMFSQFLGGRTANSSNAELLSPSPSVQTTSDSEMTWPI